MNKLLRKIKNLGLVSIASAMTIAPIAITLTSCSKKQNVEISSIELSCRPSYICPGETLQIHKVVYPVEAYDNDTIWEVDSPIEGFSITKDGLLKAPKSFQIDKPTMLHVKATDKANPEVYDTLAVGITNVPEGDQAFLGFADNAVNYTDVNGNLASVEILQDPNNKDSYYTKEPINLFMGRVKEEIEFIPIVARGHNTRMKFHLHGDKEYLRSLAWFDYPDNSWTDAIPAFRVQFIQYQYDTLDILFGCDMKTHLSIRFNVWQSPQATTECCMHYNVEDGYHPITEVGQNMYSCYIDLPENGEGDELVESQMNNIYVYRKPYEYLEDGFVIENEVFHYETEPLEGIFHVDPTITPTKTVWREYDNYPAYTFNLSWSYKPSDFQAYKWGYKTLTLFTLRVRDGVGNVTCSCTFFANWVRGE